MKFLLRLVVFLLLLYGVNVRSVDAYIISGSRYDNAQGTFFLDLAFTSANVQTITIHNGRKVPDISSVFNSAGVLAAIQAKHPDMDFGSGFNASQLDDVGLYGVSVCLWPRANVSGVFDVQICTVYRFAYLTTSGSMPLDCYFGVPFFFYGVLQTNDDIRSKNISELSFTYSGDQVQFPFFGDEHTLYAYQNVSVRQYPIGYNGRTSISSNKINNFAYGTVEECAAVLNGALSSVHTWFLASANALNSVGVLFFRSQDQTCNWIVNKQISFAPVVSWSDYDYDQGTEPDAHEFYVRHDREDPDDDWGEVPDDGSGTSGTVELGPVTQDYLNEKFDEYLGDDNSDVEMPSLPSASSALEDLDEPDNPDILTESQYQGVKGTLESKIQNSPVGNFQTKLQTGLGSSAASLPVYSIALPAGFRDSTFDIDLNFLLSSPYNTYFNFLRALVKMFLFLCCVIFVYRDLRDTFKD